MKVKRTKTVVAGALLLATGLLLLAGLALGLTTGGQAAGPATALNILHTNDTWGYVDPCG